MTANICARTLYVGDKKYGAEFQKIGDAVKVAEPGDEIIIYSGTYQEAITFPRSGMEGKPITISSYPGHIVNVMPGIPITGTPKKVKGYPDVYCWDDFSLKEMEYSIWEPASHLRLTKVFTLKMCQSRLGSWFYDTKKQKLYVRGTGVRQADKLTYMLVHKKNSAFHMKKGISHITIKGINVSFAANGVKVDPKTSGIVVENCKFFCNDVAGIYLSGDHHKVLNNECFYNNHYGIQMRLWIEYCEIRDNVCYYNGPNNGEQTSTSVPCDISIYSRGRHVLFSGNIIDGLHQYAMRNKYGGNASVMLRNNVIRGCFYWQGKCMESNTVIVTDLGSRFGMYINRVRPDQTIGIDTIDPRGTQRRSNIIWPAVDKKNPQFVDPAWRDFRLQGDSPYHGKGAYPTYAAALYIDPVNGNDANDGLSVATPLKTIEYAFTVLHPDYTLYLLPGVYKEKIVLDIREKTKSLSDRLYLSGYSKASPLVFRAYGRSGNAVLQGGVELKKSTYVRFEGIVFKDEGIKLSESSEIWLKECVFDVKKTAVELKDSTNISFNHCTFTNAESSLTIKKCKNIRITNSLFANTAKDIVADADSEATVYTAYNHTGTLDLEENYFLPDGSDLSYSSAEFSWMGAKGEKPADRLKIEDLRSVALSPVSATLLWRTPRCVTDSVVEIKNLSTGKVRKVIPHNTFQIMGEAFDMTFRIGRYFTVERYVSVEDLKPDTEYSAVITVTNAEKNSTNSSLVKFKTPADPSKPKIYYIAPDGNDSNTGESAKTAWSTFQKAGSHVGPGDRVIVLPGVYSEMLSPQTSGTKDQPIVFESAEPGSVVIDLKESLPAGVEIMNANYIHVKGFVIKGGKFTVGENFVIGYSRGIRISGCRVVYPSGASFDKLKLGHGGLIAVDSPDIEVIDNVFMCGYVGVSVAGCHGAKIFNNTFIGEGNYGIVIIPDSRNESYNIKNNLFYKPVMGYKTGPAIWMMNTTTKIDCDYNLFYIPEKYKGTIGKLPETERIRNLEEWQKLTGYDKHSIEAKPIFMDPVNGDFRLKKGSPGITSANDKGCVGARVK